MTLAEQIATSSSLPRRRGKSLQSLRLISAAHSFLERAHPTTVRGVCYRLFVDGVIDSMAVSNTQKVSRLLVDAREAGDIPWEWIVDETRDLERAHSWRDPAAYVRTVRHSYRRDFWDLQPHRVEVWSEKGTIRGVLKPVLDEYGVGFRVMHGFGSATALYDVAQNTENDRALHVLYVGDFDPSGMCMSERDLPERLKRYEGNHVLVSRIALVRGDTKHLPSFPLADKRRDPRSKWFGQRYGNRCWELDAMDPNDVRDRVRGAIDNLIEPLAWERCVIAQEAEQQSLEQVLDRWVAP